MICSLQNESADHPIAPDKFRKQLYAAHLNKYLSMDDDVAFEDLTLVVSSLHPIITDVAEHKDTMNDSVAGYTRTCCLYMSFLLLEDENTNIVQLQVCWNFFVVVR